MLPNYNFKQQALYQIAKVLHAQLSQDLAEFQTFKANYATILTSLQTAANDAMAVPNEQQRNANYEMSRKQLLKRKETFLDLFKKLKRYISTAYTESEAEIQHDSAGQNWYEAAFNDNWVSLMSLSSAAKDYAVANDQLLQQQAFAPSSFAADVLQSHDDVQNSYQDYLAKQQEASELQQEKIAKDNALYDIIRTISADAKVVLDEAKAKTYEVKYLRTLVDGGGAQGVKGKITDDNDIPISGVIVEIVELGLKETTGSDGKYSFIKGVKAGDYTLKFTHTDYQTTNDVCTVSPNIVSQNNQSLSI